MLKGRLIDGDSQAANQHGLGARVALRGEPFLRPIVLRVGRPGADNRASRSSEPTHYVLHHVRGTSETLGVVTESSEGFTIHGVGTLSCDELCTVWEGPLPALSGSELRLSEPWEHDLASQSTRLTNRLRDALLHIHPGLERLVGPRLERGGVLDLLAAAPTPQALRELGADGIAELMRPRSPRLARTLPAQILTALDAQTVVVPGTTAFGRVITGVATQLREVRTERDTLATELGARLEAHPLAEVLTSMPGLGFRTALKILTIVGDGPAFPTAGHLAAYAGLAPVTRRSGTSIRGETRSQRGNHALKSALFLSAFASLSDPTSRAYYDRKRAEKKRHNAVLICLARRRLDVIYAMLRDRTPYVSPAPSDLSPAAAAA